MCGSPSKQQKRYALPILPSSRQCPYHWRRFGRPPYHHHRCRPSAAPQVTIRPAARRSDSFLQSRLRCRFIARATPPARPIAVLFHAQQKGGAGKRDPYSVEIDLVDQRLCLLVAAGTGIHCLWVRYSEACFGLDVNGRGRDSSGSACVPQAALGVSPRASEAAAGRRRQHPRRVRSSIRSEIAARIGLIRCRGAIYVHGFIRSSAFRHGRNRCSFDNLSDDPVGGDLLSLGFIRQA